MLSLKARALELLAQREQSRVELRRKLLRIARVSRVSGAEPADEDTQAATAAEVDALIDWLEARRYLSVERFVESRVHARAPRFGELRIRNELREHGLSMPADAAATLRASELERARAVHARKFTAPAANATEQARQMRFLIGRGFSPEVASRAVRESSNPDRD